MEVRFEANDPATREADALIVPVASRESGRPSSDLAERIDQAFAGQLSRLAEDERFTGGVASTAVIPTLGHVPARRIVLVGLGAEGNVTEDNVVRAFGEASRAARKVAARRVVAALPDTATGLDAATALEAAALGTRLGLYRFERYRGAAAPSDLPREEIEAVVFMAPDVPTEDAERALRRADAIAEAVNFARDLGNEPASVLTPETLAERATAIAGESGLAIEVLGPAELRSLAAAATLAVGGGSAHGPRMIRLRYEPGDGGGGSRVPGLVGKAITFDTGGYSIKTYEGMLDMKGDMAGGAAVLATMSSLRALHCPVPVEATICAAENMISGSAFRPGDVITGMNGVTMEILSTDAEGRLVLADGLVDTARRGATELIDLATLTGAAIVALGEGTTALFANDEGLAGRLLAAGNASGERLWRMPLIDELEKKIEGDVADIKNVGGRNGGAITAALFLQHFSEGLPWAHLDIAGSARKEKADAMGPKGATGVGVRTLLKYLVTATGDESRT